MYDKLYDIYYSVFVTKEEKRHTCITIAHFVETMEEVRKEAIIITTEWWKGNYMSYNIVTDTDTDYMLVHNKLIVYPKYCAPADSKNIFCFLFFYKNVVAQMPCHLYQFLIQDKSVHLTIKPIPISWHRRK